MTDSLGWRRKFGVIAPSTNTSVQPEFDAMWPVGVTNHFGCIAIPNMRLANDDDFNALMDAIRGTIMDAADSVTINTATYSWALRQNEIIDKVQNFGALIEKH